MLGFLSRGRVLAWRCPQVCPLSCQIFGKAFLNNMCHTKHCLHDYLIVVLLKGVPPFDNNRQSNWIHCARDQGNFPHTTNGGSLPRGIANLRAVHKVPGAFKHSMCYYIILAWIKPDGLNFCGWLCGWVVVVRSHIRRRI